jgi:hypothetical protein
MREGRTMKTIMTLVSFLVGLGAVVSSGAQDLSTPPSTPKTKEELELEKLRLEVQSLSRTTKWEERAVKFTPILSVLIAGAAVGATVWQYQAQGARQAELSRREEMKPLLDRQTELYMEASKVVARLAQAPSPPERSVEDVRKFWELYNGPLIIVESHGVSGAMKDFGECLGHAAECSAGTLQARSRALSTAILKSIGADSKMTPSEFAASRFHYGK